MPVGRIILKSICQSKKLSTLKTDGARLLYTWLLTQLDVNGCFSGDPIVINGQIFTRLNKSSDTVESYLEDLAQNKLIFRYSTNGDEFLWVPDFVEKQPALRPDREGKTSIPTPTPDQLRTKSGATPAQVKLSKVKLSKDSPKWSETSDEYQLSQLLLNLIKKRNPKIKNPNLEKWAEHIDLMVRIDKRKSEEIRAVISWCQEDKFWQNNILSTEKLRKQFDQLSLKMDTEVKKYSPKDSGLCEKCGAKGKYIGGLCVDCYYGKGKE